MIYSITDIKMKIKVKAVIEGRVGFRIASGMKATCSVLMPPGIVPGQHHRNFRLMGFD